MRRAIFGLLFLAALLAGCNRDRVVWFVQVTDPHFFEDITDPRKLPDPTKEKWDEEEKARVFREGLSRDAFTDLMKALGALPGRKGKPDFLVITGDFGIDRFLSSAVIPEGGTPGGKTGAQTPAVSTEAPNPGGAQGTNAQSSRAPTSTPVQAVESLPNQADPEARKKEIDDAVEEVARRLRDSPVRDIFLVPGNNDVLGEDAGSPALAASAGFFDRVQARLAGNDVVLHDLSACYLGDQEPLSKCYFDIPGTPYRLVGFPSHSFKNKGKVENVEKYNLYQAAQEKQIEVLSKLVQLALTQRRKVLVLTHIPELDDPHTLGQQRFAGKTPKKGNQTNLPPSSAWNVSPTVVTRWNEIIGSETVAGVIAGHFHDSHREIYSPPYRWAADISKRPTLDKLFLAPPLAARLQDTSPIQARGFAAFVLAGDRPRRQLYWYDGVARTFQPEAEGERALGVAREESREREAGWIERFGANFAWIWTLPESPQNLARAAILSIALLAAFLTVVQVWQIPPPVEGPDRSSPAGSGAVAATASPRGTTTTTTTVTSPSGTTSTTNAVTTNVFQSNLGKTVASGLTGLAVAVFLEEFWNQTQLNEKAYYLVLFSTFFLAMLFTSALFRGIGEALRSQGVIYRSHSSKWGAWRWLLSWRSASLVFLDTAFNVIQGRNQMQSAVFERQIVDLNWSMVWTADRVREAVERAVIKALEETRRVLADHEDVRVSVLVLSDDGRSAFCVSAVRGSAGPFGEESIPVAAIRGGEARRYKLDDSKSPVGEKDSPWIGSDHQDFLVLPVPWTRLAEAVPARQAALHLSFRNAEDLDHLWEGRKTQGEATRHAELATVLRQALEVLGESLRYFNQTIFEERIRPYRKS